MPNRIPQIKFIKFDIILNLAQHISAVKEYFVHVKYCSQPLSKTKTPDIRRGKLCWWIFFIFSTIINKRIACEKI